MSMRNPWLVLLTMLIVCVGRLLWPLVEADSEEELSICLWSPEIFSDTGSTGTWTIDWPSWPASKGDPRLQLRCWSDPSRGEQASFVLAARVQPPDAVRNVGVDAEGWFRIGREQDSHVAPTLQLSAVSIEHRVLESSHDWRGKGCLHIYGSLDGSIRETIDGRLSVVNRMTAVLLAALAGWWLFLTLRARKRVVA